MFGAFVVVDALSAVVGAALQGTGGGGAQGSVPPAPSASAIHAEKIRDNLYILRGGGKIYRVGDVDLPQAGTAVAFITSRGVVLVDTKLPGWGQPIIDKLKGITDKPVTTIISTTRTWITSAAMWSSRERRSRQPGKRGVAMKEMRPVSGGPMQPNIFKEHDGRGFRRGRSDRMTLGTGDEQIDLYYFRHTSGDAWVVFPSLRAASGDVRQERAAAGCEQRRQRHRIRKRLPGGRDSEEHRHRHHRALSDDADDGRLEDLRRIHASSSRRSRRPREPAGRLTILSAWKLPDGSSGSYVDFSHRSRSARRRSDLERNQD